MEPSGPGLVLYRRPKKIALHQLYVTADAQKPPFYCLQMPPDRLTSCFLGPLAPDGKACLLCGIRICHERFEIEWDQMIIVVKVTQGSSI